LRATETLPEEQAFEIEQMRAGDTTTAYPVPVLSEIVVGTFNR
jgi:hypothetical protein